MEIEGAHIVLRAANFDRTCHFYEQVLGFARVAAWDGESVRGASFVAGGAVVEVLGRTAGGAGRDEAFDYQGPQHKMSLAFEVPSAEKAYEELLFRDQNISGGLRSGGDGALVFETHDPDGVKILFREATP